MKCRGGEFLPGSLEYASFSGDIGEVKETETRLEVGFGVAELTLKDGRPRDGSGAETLRKVVGSGGEEGRTVA